MSSCLTSGSDALAFLRCQGQQFDFALQNYNKKMIYARGNEKKLTEGTL